MALYVNGQEVDQKDIQAEADKLRPRYEQVFADMPEDERETQLMEWSRENVIEAVLMAQAAERDIEDPPDEVIQQAYENLLQQAGGKEEFFNQTGLSPDKADEIKADIAKRLKLERLIAQINEHTPEPSEKEIRKYYEQNIDRFTIPEMVRASHIVKHPSPAADPESIRQEMTGLLIELRAGADFTEIASRGSDCPDNGGDLGYFARGQMVQEFDDVVFNMQPGEISDIFTTEFGMHIARVTERKPSIPCELDQVREVIEKELSEQAQQKALENFVDTEKEKAKIEEK